MPPRAAETDPTALSAGFPLRIGAADIGSNAVRFLAAEFTSVTQYRELEAERLSLRLGHEVFRTGQIAHTSQRLLLGALGRWQRIWKRLGVKSVRVVATSAVREAKNAEALIKGAQRLGLKLEVISGSEEARLVYQAIKATLPLGRKPWLMANLGGGSLEIFLADRQNLRWSESHTLGAVRLLEELQSAASAPERLRSVIEAYVSTLRLPAMGQERIAGVIVTGGNAEALARLAKAPETLPNVRRLGLGDLRRLSTQLAGLSPEARVRRFALPQDRADVILPGAQVLERLGSLAKVRTLWVVFAGTKEGLLRDQVETLTAPGRHQVQQESDLSHAALSLGEHYRFDRAHHLQVARLALSLFDQMKSLHALGEPERRLLLAAALLHDIGGYISYKKHHKHSYYLIAQSELPGFTPAEMQVVGNVARYHRKSAPQLTHEAFALLAPKDQRRVRQLAAFLRLADALDRDHRQGVKEVVARPTGSSLQLSLKGLSALENWALKRKSELFTRVYGLKVTVIPEQRQGS